MRNIKKFIITFGRDFAYIGILLCKNADKASVEYAIRAYNRSVDSS